MDRKTFKACIHPKEFPRFILACFFAVPLAIAVVLACVFTFGIVALYIGLIVLFVWIGFRTLYAVFVGNAVLVSELNYPRVKRLLDEARDTIGVKKKVHVFVFDESSFNAAFSYMFGRYAIFLNSALLEQEANDKELRWIMGRFIGRIRAKKRLGIFNWAIEMTERILIFNFFLLPYERATVYSGDRIALADINGDISTAVEAMNKLYTGAKLGYAINPAGIVEQRRLIKGSFFSFLARIMSPMPHMTDRYVDLIAFARRAYPAEYARFVQSNPSFPPPDNMMGIADEAANDDIKAA